jgi:hypothetical protein
MADSPEELAVLHAVESSTNPRVQGWGLTLVDPEDWITGAGTTPIMAAFCKPNKNGSRFSDGRFGVYYAAESLDTAIAETRYHVERSLRLTHEAPVDIDMRSYTSTISGRFFDIRGKHEQYDRVYDLVDYASGQAMAKEKRKTYDGIVYDSVRREGCQCVTVFRPPCIEPVTQRGHYRYHWDGEKVAHVLKISLQG